MTKLAGKSAPPEQSPVSLSEKAEAIAGAWAEARLLYPLYFYLSTHFHLTVTPVHDATLPAACPATELFDQVIGWLDEMDAQIRPNQLRQLLHSLKEVRPESLRALILRLLRHTQKSPTDRDNIDLLLATYFALCAPEDLYACEITLGDVAQVLQNVLVDADATELEWCGPLNQVLDAMKECRGLREVFAAKLLEKGRELKDAAGYMFYDPAALVAFTRFNFLVRRSFFRLLHADLRAIREGLTELERRGISTVDCRTAGLAQQEPVGHLREISLSWRQPISSDYAAESANKTFEQLLAIRAAVERALGIVPAEIKVPVIDSVTPPEKPKPIAPEASPQPATQTAAPQAVQRPSRPREIIEPPAAPAQPAPKPRVVTLPSRNAAASPQVPATAPAVQPVRPVAVPAAPAKPIAPVTAQSPLQQPAAAMKAPPTPPMRPAPAAPTVATAHAERADVSGTRAVTNGNVLSPDLEKCLEGIWEQLIEAPPTRGRSMSTVNLGDARILLSAWEVNAFVSDGGQLSEDLRRAVAARSLIALAREEQKASGDPAKLNSAIALGREEMKYLQVRVDQAQRMKNTEAAVNLGISARRLLSTIEEAQA
ncbi:MAG TPA: hypothetical protein VKB26_05850 [Candidatus Acidoferrales bacterium]|nr:hypothetical protein [Candidatus Acidoferrales bacterium]